MMTLAIRRLLIFGACGMLLLFCGKVWAYSSVTVPIEDPVYRQLDKLAAHGLITTMMEGQRPYVRAEIARLLAEAMENFSKKFPNAESSPQLSQGFSDKQDYVRGILDELKAEYQDELIQIHALEGEVPRWQGAPIEQASVDVLYLTEEKDSFPSNNGLGGLGAGIQPLVENRGGRHYVQGFNFALESEHWMRLGKYFSVQASPRFQIQSPSEGDPMENKVFVQRLNGHFTWNKLDIEIGRDALNWGPTPEGGLAFSNNARPLDFIKLSSVSPFRYPFLFKKIGLNEWSLVVANLGPEQKFKNPWFVSYKNSNRGNPYFELGFSQTLILGGEGAPPISFGQGVAEFFGAGSGNGTKSNRNFSVDLHGRVPKLRGLQLYGELYFEDFDFNANLLFVYDLSYLAGLRLPRLNDSGTVDLRLEYRHLSPRYARSPVFTDGITENRFLIGDPLGPDSQGVLAEVNWDIDPKNLLSMGFQWSRRRDDAFLIQSQNGDVKAIDTVYHGIPEDRFLGRVGIRHRFNSHLVGRLGVGMEGVQHFAFRRNDDRLNWMGEGGLTFYFRPYLQVKRSSGLEKH